MPDPTPSISIGIAESEAHVYTSSEEGRTAAEKIASAVDEWTRTIATSELQFSRTTIFYLAMELSGEEAIKRFRSRLLNWCADRNYAAIIVPNVDTYDELQRKAAGLMGMN